MLAGGELDDRGCVARKAPVDFNISSGWIGCHRQLGHRGLGRLGRRSGHRLLLRGRGGGRRRPYRSAMLTPVLGNGFAGVLDGAAEGERGFADDGVSTDPVKHRDFVSVAQETLAAFMVQNNNVVGLVLFVIDHHLRTTFPERLDNLSGLRPSAAANRPAKRSTRASALAGNLPRLAICYEGSSFFRFGGCGGFILRGRFVVRKCCNDERS